MNRPELLAPAGNWECARAAVENGADAIYFGLDRFNARMRADNFAIADLPELMAFLHRRGVRGYATFNTLVFADELDGAEAYLRELVAAGVDAAIVQDVGVCRALRHLSPDFPIHASTQMTVTSAAGVELVRELGCQLVVLARETSLAEIEQIQQQTERSLPLEVFVHGALCVAYSGQCLTSESLGGRSANRGECAQACRMEYELIADGETVELGDRRYLLSPQDLAGVDLLPELVRAGVHALKIEGRLKTPEYVASVTRVYRQALERAIATGSSQVSERERYELEMTFSRGLYSGWLRGINNQELVTARYGKKRGVYLGAVTQVKRDRVAVRLEAPVKAGDGIVFDSGNPQHEAGGRVYRVERQGNLAWLSFGKRDLDLKRVRAGHKLWKTSDPDLDKQLRQSFAKPQPQFRRAIALHIAGAVGQPLAIAVCDEQGRRVRVESAMPLQPAARPLTSEQLADKLGRLGNTPFCLSHLDNRLQGDVMLPVSELNRLRREFVAQLEQLRANAVRWQVRPDASYRQLLPAPDQPRDRDPDLIVLARNCAQVRAAIAAGAGTIYCEFPDPRQYRDAVCIVRDTSTAEIWVAPSRIAKPRETYLLKQVRNADADGILARNYDHLSFFADDRCRGDFSLNVANPLSAAYFKDRFGLERLTASYDLNADQLAALLATAPPHWFDITIHQHVPMFHMAHCVFCAFLSDGTDVTNCGRPCEHHRVVLRDRVGSDHVLQADAGCRNTVFNGRAQTGAEAVRSLLRAGARHFRIDFLDEAPATVTRTIRRYQQLLAGDLSGADLWRDLQTRSQLGVTRGSLSH